MLASPTHEPYPLYLIFARHGVGRGGGRRDVDEAGERFVAGVCSKELLSEDEQFEGIADITQEAVGEVMWWLQAEITDNAPPTRWGLGS